MSRSSTIPPCTIVLKLGTSSIVHEQTHQPLLSTLSAVVETVVELKRQGHKVVLVSSGAIGVGLKRMDMRVRPKGLSGKQALAAIGQGRLIALWDNLFSQLEQPIAQVLLTRGDISDRTRYINAVNTFKELLSMGVVPIVNENDTVSVSEIKFGDNDTLSAITASMIHADFLFLLTDVDGLFTSNPRKDPLAQHIPVVRSIAAIRGAVSTSTLGSALGTGGMETKLIAADIAVAAGVGTVIMSSKRLEDIFEVIEADYEALPGRVKMKVEAGENAEGDAVQNKVSHSTGVAAPAAPAPASTTPAVPLTPRQQLIQSYHTLFIPSATPIRDLKAWTSHTLNPSGSIVVDAGAHFVLSKRAAGGRLLAAGVVGVIGAFASGQAVRVCVRRRVGVEEKEEERRRYLEAVESTRPGTPVEGDAEGGGEGDAGDVEGHGGVGGGVDDNDDEKDRDREMLENARVQGEIGEADVVEVGRGLANYNSAQIMAVKGMNSSMLPRVLGYADSEYVVENITIRVSLSTMSPGA